MIQNHHYDAVAKEIQDRFLVPGIWAKAFAETQGDKDRAKALYIKYRAQQLADDESVERLRVVEEEETRQTQLREAERRKRDLEDTMLRVADNEAHARTANIIVIVLVATMLLGICIMILFGR